MARGVFLVIIFTAVTASRDPTTRQLEIFKNHTSGFIGTLTLSSGWPVQYEKATSTLNTNLLLNDYFIESMTHLSRERIPVRVVHAKGVGAFGYFEVTHDVTHICKAKLFSTIGKKTPIAVRFSTFASEKGAADTIGDTRGFAIKFYTEDGNFDLVGLNVPSFSMKDPLFFKTFTHAFKRNPATNVNDDNARWDYFTQRPESILFLLLFYSDRNIPYGYRYMPGYGIHTFEVVNKNNKSHFVRFHIVPNNGIKNFTTKQAVKVAGKDPDFATKDMYNAIAQKAFPSWTIAVQILSEEDVKKAKFNVFDTNVELPINDYPLHSIGQLILNRNALNNFAEIEQLAFCPGNLVPGILGAPDKLFEARRFLYKDAQNYRLGVNFNKIPVNCPFRTIALTYERDGQPPVKDNGADSPNYQMNSFNGPISYFDGSPLLMQITQDESYDYEQAKQLYRDGFTEKDRESVFENIVSSLRNVADFLQKRAIEHLGKVDLKLGKMLHQRLQS